MITNVLGGLILALFVSVFSGCSREDASLVSDSKPTPQSGEEEKHIKPVNNQSVGTISGEVKFVGTPPAFKKILVNKDIQACGQEKFNEELMVSSGQGMRWVVAWVELVNTTMGVASIQAKPVVLDQKSCQFKPHVLLVPQGGEVKILNPDGVLHNFHTESKINPPVNLAQPGFRKEMSVKFERPEIFRIKCDAHGWMSGWIVVTQHPFYAVTDEDGKFRIDNIPVGKRLVRMWHETLGEFSKEVEVRAGKETKIVFELKK